MAISGSNLRNGLFALGGILAFVGGMDAASVAAGLQPLGLIPANIAHLLGMVGAAMIGYAKTAYGLGDASAKDVVAQVLQAKLEASQPVTTIPPASK